MFRQLWLIVLLAGVATATPQPDKFADVGGVKLWFQECGTANPVSVVLLHDGLLHSITWDAVWTPLCTRYHVVRYDRRGYGRSEASKVRFVPEDDLYQIMRQAHMDRAIVVGNSSGGGLAIDFALAHPESVSGLVLIGPVVHGMPSSAYFNERGARNSAPLAKGDVRAAAENWSKDRFLISGDDPPARQQLFDGLVQNPQNLNYAGGLEIRPSPPAVTRLSQIRVAALVLVGDADIPDVFAYSGAILAELPLAKFEVWKDTGHLVQLQRPKELVDRINSFAPLALRKELKVPDSKLKEYVGTYTCFNQASRLMLLDHHLVLEFPGDSYRWLFAASESRFFLRTTPAEIEFAKDATAKTAKMLIHNSDGSVISCPAAAPAN